MTRDEKGTIVIVLDELRLHRQQSVDQHDDMMKELSKHSSRISVNEEAVGTIKETLKETRADMVSKSQVKWVVGIFLAVASAVGVKLKS